MIQPVRFTMTEQEYAEFRRELMLDCSDHHNIEMVIAFVRDRDPELAQLIVNAELAEKAIAAYLREKDGN